MWKSHCSGRSRLTTCCPAKVSSCSQIFVPVQVFYDDADLLSPLSPDGLCLFRAFLVSEFSEENIAFYLACEDYRATKPSKLAPKAEKIYKEFIDSDAPREVCIELLQLFNFTFMCNVFNKVFVVFGRWIWTMQLKQSPRRTWSSPVSPASTRHKLRSTSWWRKTAIPVFSSPQCTWSWPEPEQAKTGWTGLIFKWTTHVLLKGARVYWQRSQERFRCNKNPETKEFPDEPWSFWLIHRLIGVQAGSWSPLEAGRRKSPTWRDVCVAR